MNDVDEAVIADEDLGRSACAVFAAACQGVGLIGPAPWQELNPDLREAWVFVAETACQLAFQGATPTATEGAKLLWSAYCFARQETMDEGAFAALARPEKIAWEAVARHLSHLCAEMDNNDDLAQLEAIWGDWARGKLAVMGEGR